MSALSGPTVMANFSCHVGSTAVSPEVARGSVTAGRSAARVCPSAAAPRTQPPVEARKLRRPIATRLRPVMKCLPKCDRQNSSIVGVMLRVTNHHAEHDVYVAPFTICLSLWLVKFCATVWHWLCQCFQIDRCQTTGGVSER